MTDFVLDSNVFVADLIGRKEANQGQRAKPYLDPVRAGVAKAHTPSIIIIEVCSALAREPSLKEPERKVMALRAQSLLRQFAEQGKIVVYQLENTRLEQAATMAMDYLLRSLDAIYVALSDELKLELVTFDENSLAEPLRRGGYTRVVVPT